MEFRFTDEQQMIRETAEAFLREQSDAAAVRRAMATEQGFEPALWEELAGNMGWSAMHIPEEFGGLGLGAVELVALMEEMGKRLLCAPFFSSVCLGATAILCAGSEAQKTALLPGIAAGTVRATLGWMGAGRDWSPSGVALACARHGDGWRLQGESHYVVDGHTADLLVLAARLPGEGLRLFALPADTAGLTRTWLPTMDQTRKLATLTLDGVQLGNDALLGPTKTQPKRCRKCSTSPLSRSLPSNPAWRSRCSRWLLPTPRSVTSSAGRSRASRRSNTRPPT